LFSVNLYHDLMVGINYKINNHFNYVFADFFKDIVKYLVWTFRDPISLILGTRMILSDYRDPILNSRDPNRLPKTP